MCAANSRSCHRSPGNRTRRQEGVEELLADATAHVDLGEGDDPALPLQAEALQRRDDDPLRGRQERRVPGETVQHPARRLRVEGQERPLEFMHRVLVCHHTPHYSYFTTHL